jgi:hypothetical protein
MMRTNVARNIFKSVKRSSTGLALAPWVVRSLALLIGCAESEIDGGTARRIRRGGSPATAWPAEFGVHNTREGVSRGKQKSNEIRS